AEACRADAARAFEIATRAGDAQALAAAHTVLAMLAALEGDRGGNDAHYLRALDYAQQAGDVLQLVRVRTNRGSRHVEEGSYEEGLSELDHALRLPPLTPVSGPRPRAAARRSHRLRGLPRACAVEPGRSAFTARSVRRGDRGPRGVARALPAARLAHDRVPAGEARRGLPDPRRRGAGPRDVRGGAPARGGGRRRAGPRAGADRPRTDSRGRRPRRGGAARAAGTRARAGHEPGAGPAHRRLGRARPSSVPPPPPT